MLNYTETIETSLRNATQQLEQEQQQLATTLQQLEKQNPATLSSLLATTTLAQQYVHESIKRSAVLATKVQILATAVLNIAGEASSMLSLTRAQDFGNPISTQAMNTHQLLDKAAYQGEQVSKMSMDSSIQASTLRFTGLLEKVDSTAGKETIAKVKTAFADAVALAQQVSAGTKEITQRIHELAFQWVEGAGATKSLETLIMNARAKNQLISNELLNSAKELNANTEKIMEPLLIALQSAYAAHSAAMQSTTIGAWISSQSDHLT